MKRENFGGKFAFIMALAGSAIGLGNIWRFPYVVGESGGAAFIVIYLIFSLVLSFPVLCCETVIGRRARAGAYVAYTTLAPGTRWNFFGILAVLSCFIINSYYSVIGGWSLEYLVQSSMFGFHADNAAASSGVFNGYVSDVWRPICTHLVFLGMTAGICVLGVKNGIEKVTKVMTPLLFVLMVIVAVYSVMLPGSAEGVRYLLKPDFSKLTAGAVADALGQSFLSMSLGVGGVIVYASYMKKDTGIVSSGFLTCLFDSGFAILAGLAIMPAVFSVGIAPSSGPSLVFETFPYIFSSLGQHLGSPVVSRIVATIFFLAIFMAALTSSISLFEVCAEHLVSHRHFTRGRAALVLFLAMAILGGVCSLSFGVLSDVRLFDNSIFDICNELSSNYLMTIGALAVALFTGWVMKKEDVRDEFTNSGTNRAGVVMFNVFYFVVKYIAPVGITVVFLANFFK